MRHRTKELVTILIAPMAVCGPLITLLFIMVVVAQAATTTVLTDSPCVYAGTTLDCRATQPPPPPPPPPTDKCGAFSRILDIVHPDAKLIGQDCAAFDWTVF